MLYVAVVEVNDGSHVWLIPVIGIFLGASLLVEYICVDVVVDVCVSVFVLLCFSTMRPTRYIEISPFSWFAFDLCESISRSFYTIASSSHPPKKYDTKIVIIPTPKCVNDPWWRLHLPSPLIP